MTEEKVGQTEQESIYEDQVRRIKDMYQPYLECRSLRHSWQMEDLRAARPGEVPPSLAGKQVVVRTSTCRRCRGVRTDFFTRTFGTLRRFTKALSRYDMPPAYLWRDLKSGLPAPDQWAYTDVLFTNMLGDD